MILLFFIPTVLAICTDSDGGGLYTLKTPEAYISIPGTVTINNITYNDQCIDTEGNKSFGGPNIKEYYCSGSQAASKEYTCTDYKLSSCTTLSGMGYCTEKTIEHNITIQSKSSTCGNEQIEEKEQCETGIPCTTHADCIKCHCIDINSTIAVNETEILKNLKPVERIKLNESISMRAIYTLASFGRAVWHWIIDTI